MSNNPPTLELQGLQFDYGKTRALDGVSLQVPAGRFVALLGANGAGKSTLFSIVTGLYSAHAGNVSVTGFDIRTQTLKALAGMGVVFQRTTLDTDLTVRQNLHYSACLQGIAKPTARERISLAFEQHGLEDYADRKITSLSGGQRRRVELARALLHKPRLVLLDEPTVGLDLQSREDFVKHVKDLCLQQGTGVLWATHLMDEVDDSDIAYVLHRGIIIAEGEVASLRENAGAENVSALFSSLLATADATDSGTVTT